MRIFIVTGRNIVLALCLLFVAAVLPLGAKAAFSNNNTEKTVFILTYHQITKNTAGTEKYIISADTLENDLIYLKEHGYKSVTLADLIAYTRGGELPDKAFMLTFDDGCLSVKTYLLPLLEKHGFKAVVSVIGAYTQRYSEARDPNPAYAYLSWEEISEVQKSGLVEIASHTWNMHSLGARGGAARRAGESLENYRTALQNDLNMLSDALILSCGIRPIAVSWPYGFVSENSDSVIAELGYVASFTCFEKAAVVTRDSESLFSLPRYCRIGTLSTARFMEKTGIK